MKLINTAILRRIFPLIVLGFLFVSAGVSNASGQNIINEILKRMDDHNKTLNSLRSNVTLVSTNAQLGVSDSREGTVMYLPQHGKDPLVRIDWKSPQETISVVNKQYALVRHRTNEAIVGNTNDVQKSPGNGNSFAFINMSRAQLKANYSVVYLGEATVQSGIKTWHLQMTPKIPAKYKSAEIWVDGNGMPIQTKINEKNNDTNTVLLTNLQKNVRINASEFKLELKGKKIIKG